MRFEAYRLAGWQLLVTALMAALLWFWGVTNGMYSVFAGGLIGILTNLWQALRMFRITGADPERFLGSLYFSEFIKVLLTVALFVFAIKVFEVELAPTISGYAACFVVHLAIVRRNFLPADSAVIEANRVGREERDRLGILDEEDRDEV